MGLLLTLADFRKSQRKTSIKDDALFFISFANVSEWSINHIPGLKFVMNDTLILLNNAAIIKECCNFDKNNNNSNNNMT